MSNQIIDDAQEELDDLLDKLGVEGDQLRAMARQVTLRSIELTSATLAGQDTTLGQQALRASVKNLEVAGALTLAHAVIGFTNRLVNRVGLIVVNAAFGAV